MSVAQFDSFLAILEPHNKKKTTNICELSAQGSPPWELELRPLGVATGNALSVTRV